ncbi:MAG: GNAT family N-acetyltransferase [Bacteroidales bacterium]|nr:GNAT family N-acetyltransferase [Bacteroidales bacterium]
MTILQQDKIKLRQLDIKDVDRLAEIANNRKISINLRDAFPSPYSEEDARSFIQMCYKQNPSTIFAIEYEGIYVGNIGLELGNDVYRKSAQIGYFIDEAFWNKGIVTQAVMQLTAFGFETLNMERIHTGVFEFNRASQRVLEKCGYHKEGVFRKAVLKNGKLYDEIRYSKLKNE